MKRSICRLFVLSVLMIIGSGPSCSETGFVGSKPGTVSTAVQIDQIAEHAADAHKDLTAATATVKAMTPTTVEASKGTALTQIAGADDSVQKIITAAPQAKKSAAADANTIVKQGKEIQNLQKSDPLKWWLTVIAIVCIVGGVAMVVASIAITALASVTWLRSGGVAVVILGIVVGTLAHFLTAFYWLVGGCFVALQIAGGVWLWLHRKILSAKAKKAIKPIPVAPGSMPSNPVVPPSLTPTPAASTA